MSVSAPVAHSPISDQEFGRVWKDPGGIIGRLRAVQNEPLGKRFLLLSLVFFLLASFDTLVMRTQLAVPDNPLVSPDWYNRFFTMHGSSMMFLFAVPFIQGVATLVLPGMLGARELPFPRLTAFAFWTFLFGGLLFYSSGLFQQEPDVGWFAYLPLSSKEFSPTRGVDFWLLGLNVAEIGAIAGAFELIIAIFKMRAPGMTLDKLPMFAWAMLVTAFMMVFAFTPLIVGSTLMELDREIGTHFYNPAGGGSVLLWQHIFWAFGHPDVYIQFLPAAGIISMIIPVFVQRPLAGYNLVVMAMIVMGFLSFGLWLHHMFTVGTSALSALLFAGASMMIGIASGVQVFSWIATIWQGRPVYKTPFLYAVGFLITFIIGGLTGIMVAVVPFDWQVHDTAFVTAHFHYVLFGGVVFPLFAGLHYWAPKYVGKFLDERWGRWSFWLMFIGFNVAFLPMHLTGLVGMPRRVYTYSAETGWGTLNLISSLGTFVIALGVALFIANLVKSYFWGEKAPQNPWHAFSLEWAMSSPPPDYGFRVLPYVHSRYPLWEQKTLDTRDPATEKLLQDMASYPLDWRSQIAISALEAKPEELFRIAGPSIAPLILALGVTIASAALIFDLYWLLLVGGAVSAVGLAIWLAPDIGAVTAQTDADEKFAQEHGIPVNAGGSVAVVRSAMWLTVLMFAIALATFLLSYIHTLGDARQWPPAGIPNPELLLPGLSAALALVSALPAFWFVRAVRRSQQRALLLGLALTFLFGLAAVVLYSASWVGLPFSPTTNAYGSLYYTLGAFLILTALVGLGILAFVWFTARRGDYHAERRVPVDNAALFWWFTVAMWVIIFVTVQLSPWIM